MPIFLRSDSVRDLSVDIRFPPEEKNQQAGFKKAGSRTDVSEGVKDANLRYRVEKTRHVAGMAS